jgi:hypothetical protein
MSQDSNGNGLDNLDDLLRAAAADGLSDATLDLVVSNLDGATMLAPVGVPLSQLAASEVTLAMNIIDASGSMAPYAADLIRAYNDNYLAALRGAAGADDILVSTLFFNDRVQLFHGYVNLADSPPLVRRVYDPDGTTALYDAVAAGLTNMVLYAQQLRQSGIMVRCIVIVYSDGADNASRQAAAAVRRASQELLQHEIYTLAYVGFGAGNPPLSEADVERLAADIGFVEALVAGLTATELRRIFHLVSFSTIGVSRQRASGNGLFR